MKGIISYNKEDRDLLLSLGVILLGDTLNGPDDTVTEECTVDEQSMRLLDSHWGQFIWSLE